MIGFISGTIKDVLESSIIVESNNIGWEIKCDVSNMVAGEKISLHVHTHVRENEIALWGFDSVEDLKFFRLLLTVSGIGPKSAHTLIVKRGYQVASNAIIDRDEKTLAVSGIGKKTVQKIILELKDKVAGFGSITSNNLQSRSSMSTIEEEAIIALESLGYRNQEVLDALTLAKNSEDISTILEVEKLIKTLLRYIS